MNKTELVDAIAESTGVSKTDTDAVITGFFDQLADAARKGEKVQITGWFTSEVVATSARTGRNPQTGAAIDIPAGKRVKLAAGAKLKNVVKE